MTLSLAVRLLVRVARTVVQPLINGKEVEPEIFPSATIYFSSIDGFMQYTESSSAYEVGTDTVFSFSPTHILNVILERQLSLSQSSCIIPVSCNPHLLPSILHFPLLQRFHPPVSCSMPLFLSFHVLPRNPAGMFLARTGRQAESRRQMDF